MTAEWVTVARAPATLVVALEAAVEEGAAARLAARVAQVTARARLEGGLEAAADLTRHKASREAGRHRGLDRRRCGPAAESCTHLRTEGNPKRKYKGGTTQSGCRIAYRGFVRAQKARRPPQTCRAQIALKAHPSRPFRRTRPRRPVAASGGWRAKLMRRLATDARQRRCWGMRDGYGRRMEERCTEHLQPLVTGVVTTVLVVTTPVTTPVTRGCYNQNCCNNRVVGVQCGSAGRKDHERRRKDVKVQQMSYRHRPH